MNKILVLTVVMAFAGTAHAQTSVHPKGAIGIVNKASVMAQNNASTAASTSTAANAANATRNGASKCIQADAPKNGTTGTPCHPARTAQL